MEPQKKCSPFEGAHRKGEEARKEGKKKDTCPYLDHRAVRKNNVTFSRAFIRAWERGWEEADTDLIERRERKRSKPWNKGR